MTSLSQDTYEYGYKLALEIAWKEMAGADIERQCERSGAVWHAPLKAINLAFINRPCRILPDEQEVSYTDRDEPAPLREKILILHYFLQAKGTPSSGETLTYKELKEGINYFPIFSKRAIWPIVNFFGAEPETLVEAAAKLGGRSSDYGDVAVTIDAFARVPVTYVLWRGDEEFTPDGSVLFDKNVSDYLTNDDIHALTEIIAWKMVKLRK